VQLQVVVSANGALTSATADNANRTGVTVLPVWFSGRGVRSFREWRRWQNEGCRAPTRCNPAASILTKGVRHRHASVARIKLHS
jgi:hypothetical protein